MTSLDTQCTQQHFGLLLKRACTGGRSRDQTLDAIPVTRLCRRQCCSFVQLSRSTNTKLTVDFAALPHLNGAARWAKQRQHVHVRVDLAQQGQQDRYACTFVRFEQCNTHSVDLEARSHIVNVTRSCPIPTISQHALDAMHNDYNVPAVRTDGSHRYCR